MTILVITNEGKLKTYKNVTDISYDERIDRIELTVATKDGDSDVVELVDVRDIRKLEAII